MKENLEEILLEYKDRINEIENKNAEFNRIEEEINTLVEERVAKNEELNLYTNDDFFYKETQDAVKSIQANIDEKNELSKQLKKDAEQDKEAIKTEIKERIQSQKKEINDQLKQDKESKEKMLAEIKEYEDRTKEWEERNAKQLELHGTEIQLSQAALERMEVQKQEVAEKRKLIEEIDERTEVSRANIKDYNEILKAAQDESFDSIKKYIMEVSEKQENIQKSEISEAQFQTRETEPEIQENTEYPELDEDWQNHLEDPYEQETNTDEYPEYPEMDEEWEKHVQEPYTQEEIDKQTAEAWEQKSIEDENEKARVELETKYGINKYMNQPLTADDNFNQTISTTKATNTKTKVVQPRKIKDKNKLDIKISSKDNKVYLNGEEIDLNIEEIIENKKYVFKQVEELYQYEEDKMTINDMIADELETINPISIALLKRKLDPAVIYAIMESKTDYKEASIRDYISAMKNKELYDLGNLKIEYDDLRQSSLKEKTDKKMQRYGRFANDVLGIDVKGVKERGPKALFKAFMDRVTTLKLTEGRGSRESIKEETIPEELENKFTERDVKNNFVPLADEHIKAKLSEISKRFSEEQENEAPNIETQKDDIKITKYSKNKDDGMEI